MRHVMQGVLAQCEGDAALIADVFRHPRRTAGYGDAHGLGGTIDDRFAQSAALRVRGREVPDILCGELGSSEVTKTAEHMICANPAA